MENVIFWLLIELSGAILGYLCLFETFKYVEKTASIHGDEFRANAEYIRKENRKESFKIITFLMAVFIWPLAIILYLIVILLKVSKWIINKKE